MNGTGTVWNTNIWEVGSWRAHAWVESHIAGSFSGIIHGIDLETGRVVNIQAKIIII